MKAPGKSIKLHPGAFSGPPYEEGALSDAAVQTEYHKDMKGNDLSAEIVPHLALVAEGALMFIDEKLDKQFQKYMDRGRYADAIRLWHISQPMAAAVWKVTWHMSYQLDIITFLGPKEFAKALEEWLAEQELPVNNVYATTPELLGRQLSYRPDIIRVYDPFPDHQLMYGPRGRLINNVDQLGF